MHFNQHDRRSRHLSVRVTDDEMAVLETMATDHDVTVAQFVRRALAAAVRGSSDAAREGAELAAA